VKTRIRNRLKKTINYIKKVISKIKNVINNRKYKKYLFHTCYVFIFTILLLIDDHIFKLFNDNSIVNFFSVYFFLAMAVAIILSLVKSKKIIYLFLSLFFFLNTSLLAYLAYYGTYLDPNVVPLVFLEIPEIALAGFGEFHKTYYVFIATGIPYFCLFYMTKKFSDGAFKVKYIWLLLLLLLCYFPRRASRTPNISTLLANPERPTLYNGLKVYSGYLWNIRTRKVVNIEFKPYVLETTKPMFNDINIVLVYGESFNTMNSSLYGYEKETMPLLTELSKTDKNFLYKKGISCATTTHTSLPTFFNSQREPENYDIQLKQEFNLFRLAKQAGFGTYWISGQEKGLLVNMGVRYMDVNIVLQKKVKDEYLLEYLQKYDFNKGNNFIVLHQRNMHAPYWLNYNHKKEQFEKWKDGKIATYDNSMLYNDYILYEYIQFFKKQNKPFIMFITSDHGDLTGQNGKYGHGILDPLVSDIPAILYTNIPNNEIYKKFKETFLPTHNEISSYILEIMGYKIINPNTPNNVYYINNTDLMGRGGYMKVIKDSKNKKVNYEIIR
jgi:glucan phosphoethanolaminetransferase (alkaline phosphatase superfamily)